MLGEADRTSKPFLNPSKYSLTWPRGPIGYGHPIYYNVSRFCCRHYLQRQHRLKLRTKAAQVERELEEDRHFLQELQRIQEAQEEATFEEKENLKRELQWMYSVKLIMKCFCQLLPTYK